MSLSLRKFKTDFTSFLDDKVRHTVKIVTDREVLECSGMILSQHSEILKQLVLEDDEIFLDNYIHVRDCLTILYGGSVTLTMENIQDIMKFSVQFDIPEILEQAVAWIERTVDETNILEFVKMCDSTVKCAKIYGRKMDVDFYWSCRRFIVDQNEATIEEIIANVISGVGQDSIFNILVDRSFISHFLPKITSFIDQENVQILVKMVHAADINEVLAICPDDEVNHFFEKIETFEKPLEDTKLFYEIKKSVVKQKELNSFVTKMYRYSRHEILKSWKDMNEKEIISLCRFAPKEDHFYLLEVIMSWVGLLKPKLKVVQELWNAVLPSVGSFTPIYLDHVICIFNTLGYDLYFNRDLANRYRTNRRCMINNIDYQVNEMHHITGATIRFDYKIPGDIGHSRQNISNAVVIINQFESVKIDAKCKDKVSRIYARTYSGEHIPLYTDLEKAAGMVYDPATFNMTVEEN